MKEEPIQIGCKIGSLNTAVAMREGSEIVSRTDRTFVRYPMDFLNSQDRAPIVGEEATIYEDAIKPLNLGVIKSEVGVRHTADILRTFNLPKNADIVLASPAVEMLEGKKLLARAVKEACNYRNLWVLSEGLCSAVYILKSVDAIKNSTFFSINMGSTTTEIGCFSEGQRIHLSAHAEICGDKIDSNIGINIKNVMGDSTVTRKDIRSMKEAASMLVSVPFIVRGVSTDGIIEKMLTTEITDPIDKYARSVAAIIQREIIENITPEIRSIALKHPIIMSGGMSNIEGLPELITKYLSESMHYEFKSEYSPIHDSHIAPAIGALMLCEAKTAK